MKSRRWMGAAAAFAVDLFTPDGEFSVSQQWGVAGARKTKDREALASPPPPGR